MKKLILILLCFPLLFTTCKKEDDVVAPAAAAFINVYGCTDENAVNFNSSANVYVPNICCYSTGCELGCTDEAALNYNFQATVDDGSCISPAAASWNCDGQSCYDPGTGLGQYNSFSSCIASCGVTASWNCDGQGSCYDPGTGLGQYPSLSSCQSNCGSAGSAITAGVWNMSSVIMGGVNVLDGVQLQYFWTDGSYGFQDIQNGTSFGGPGVGQWSLSGSALQIYDGTDWMFIEISNLTAIYMTWTTNDPSTGMEIVANLDFTTIPLSNF